MFHFDNFVVAAEAVADAAWDSEYRRHPHHRSRHSEESDGCMDTWGTKRRPCQERRPEDITATTQSTADPGRWGETSEGSTKTMGINIARHDEADLSVTCNDLTLRKCQRTTYCGKVSNYRRRRHSPMKVKKK